MQAAYANSLPNACDVPPNKQNVALLWSEKMRTKKAKMWCIWTFRPRCTGYVMYSGES